MISVMMPAFNAGKYLGHAINGLIAQTHMDWELIIIDDHSDKPVCKIPSLEGKVKVIRNKKNIGHTKSLNIALKQCKGDYIALMDADDIAEPTRFEKQLSMFKDNIGLVSTHGITINEDGNRIRDFYTDKAQRNFPRVIRRKIKDDCWILGPSMMFKREVFDKIGFFDETLYLANDVNYWVRGMKYFGWVKVEEELYRKRRHRGQVRKAKPELRNTNWHKMAIERAEECPIIKSI